MKVKASGQGYIEHGNIKREFKNHFVTGGLELMAWLFSCNIGPGNTDMEYWSADAILVGADTATQTTFSMSTLVSPINILINASTLYNIYYFNGSTASARIISIYPVSALPSATIGEIGFNGSFISYAQYIPLNLISRASNADGDFIAFAYNPANQLQITWNLIFSWV